ncbi:Solanesyl diphosphate synthase 3 [Abeliophyllum distichum]|uniref:Solanesyl diphosphate synthase 3 n=1 Tax=Abeliophyllum distichum TaxID=126358 RepID=A0ABD1UHA1_9LAMI
MFFARGLTRIARSGYSRSRWILCYNEHQLLHNTNHFPAPIQSSGKVLGCRVIYSWVSSALSGIGQQAHHQSSSIDEEQLDPFSLVADELSILANRLRSMVVAEVPKLASAAEYFFKMGVEGKRFRPTVLLLMATALNLPTSRLPP